MLLKELNSATGVLHIELINPSGEAVVFDGGNLVVDTGLTYIISRMKESTSAPMSHIAAGTGTVDPVAVNSALGAEIGRAVITSTVAAGKTIVYSVTFVPGVATGAISEAGIFNDATAGTMLCRTVFPVINKQVADTMSITWTVTLNDATP
jgi:hypothetical protein